MLSPTSEAPKDNEENVQTQWKNLTLNDEEGKNSDEIEQPASPIDDKALRMMQKMGYKSGAGLGKNEQGITKVVDIPVQLGKRGFGLTINGLAASSEKWNFSSEEPNVEEKVVWLENSVENMNFPYKLLCSWIKEGEPQTMIDEEHNFCDKTVLHNVLKAKDIFDELDSTELCQARSKANPFETIRSVFFMNRAALKMANIDAATDFMFTNIDQNPHHEKHKGPFYFADVCAGPGGFSEYILWRKKWFFKGFGLTLKDENDFRLTDSLCASPVTFQSLYGAQDDGNVCCPENIVDFREKLLSETDGKGVHFMMSDGGFSVDGNENMQEILSKNIYICQCLVALEIVRNHGHFVTKLFDTFTLFSVGLLFLMYKCFEKVAILKPNSSRPANSERYFICCNLHEKSKVDNIKKYLWDVVNRLWELKDKQELDILEIVPLDIIKQDNNFFTYIFESNNRLGNRQIMGLEKLATFCRNPSLVETRQDGLRKKSLEYWKIPDNPKTPLPHLNIDDLLSKALNKPEILLVQPREVNKIQNLEATVADLNDWHYCVLCSSMTTNNFNFYASLSSSKVYRLQHNKWVRIKNIQLVRGTLLYGEFVKETIITKTHSAVNAESESCKYSLHVIDALRLGETSLADMKFSERMNLIQAYCKSVNREFQHNSIRIRPKTINKLMWFNSKPLIRVNKQTGAYFSSLPKLDFKSSSELFDVNSILLLKTNEYQSFYSTYVLRVQICIKSTTDQKEEEHTLSLDTLTNFINEKL